MRVFRCGLVWVGDEVLKDIDIQVGDDGMIRSVGSIEPGVTADLTVLPGLVLPGFANAHSHAFHRALRGRTHSDGGTFWTWRERMYQVAAWLEPDTYYQLARAVYGEMALAGVTCVGEFHYVHHQVDGTPYADPNAMAESLRAAARDAGLRLTLLDTCYLSGGLGPSGHQSLSPQQLRFGDGSAAQWAERFGLLAGDEWTIIGAALHSVRAVPAEQIPTVVAASVDRPLHVHLSEQVAENLACDQEYGVTPTRVLADAGALGPMTTAVHATHPSAADIGLLGRSGTTICCCPTTERDLADGIGPMGLLIEAGSPVCLGTDQHAVIDLVEEARAMEMHERIASHNRGRLQPVQLMEALTRNGHRSLGWFDSGRIAVGMRADLVAIRLDSVRTAGSDPSQFMFAASASDVDTVVAGGVVIVKGGKHSTIDVESELIDSLSLMQ